MKPLKYLIWTFSFFYSIPTHSQDDSQKYLTNAWIVTRETENGKETPPFCTTFLHKDGDFGAWCKEENELQMQGKWTMSGNSLTIKSGGKTLKCKIITQTPSTLVFETRLERKKIRMYCEWK